MMLSYDEKQKRSMLAEIHQKVKAEMCCPNCGEKYWEYLTKKDKVKGIMSYEKSFIEKQSTFKSKHRFYLSFYCYTCGFTWYTKRK